MTMQYRIKKPNQQWEDSVLKDREPDMLHEVIRGVPEITIYGGLGTLTWEWEMIERRYSSGETIDSLKAKWFDAHDDYEAAWNCCPSLQCRDFRGVLQMKVGVTSVRRKMPSGHHRSTYTDDAGIVHDLKFHLIELKGKTFQQVICSRCGVIDEAVAQPILKTQAELKRWRNKLETRFSVTYEDSLGNERMGSFKSFYQAYAYAIGKRGELMGSTFIQRAKQ